MGRQQQQDAAVTIGGRNLGNWAGLDGGDVDSSPTVYYPGGMRPARSQGGAPTTGDVTVEKLLDDLSDDDVRYIIEACGKAVDSVLTRLFLDSADRASRRPMVYRGTPKGFAIDPYNASSADPLLIHVTFTITGKPTLA